MQRFCSKPIRHELKIKSNAWHHTHLSAPIFSPVLTQCHGQYWRWSTFYSCTKNIHCISIVASISIAKWFEATKMNHQKYIQIIIKGQIRANEQKKALIVCLVVWYMAYGNTAYATRLFIPIENSMPIVHTFVVVESFQSFAIITARYYLLITSFNSGEFCGLFLYFFCLCLCLCLYLCVYVFFACIILSTQIRWMNISIKSKRNIHFAYIIKKEQEMAEKQGEKRCKNIDSIFFKLLNRFLNFLKENRSKSITIELNMYVYACMYNMYI